MNKEICFFKKNRQPHSQNTFTVVISSNHRAGPGREWSFPPIVYEPYTHKSEKHGSLKLLSYSIMTGLPVEFYMQMISD